MSIMIVLMQLLGADEGESSELILMMLMITIILQSSEKPLDGSVIAMQDIYSGYSYNVNVIYDGNYDGVSDRLTNAKLITVTVTMPNDETLDFATYRSNY